MSGKTRAGQLGWIAKWRRFQDELAARYEAHPDEKGRHWEEIKCGGAGRRDTFKNRCRRWGLFAAPQWRVAGRRHSVWVTRCTDEHEWWDEYGVRHQWTKEETDEWNSMTKQTTSRWGN